MRQLGWKPEKNEWLKRERGLSFEQIGDSIASGGMKGLVVNRAHPEQIVIAVMVNGYLVAVPATAKPNLIMLWTAYYSRKLDRRFRGKNS